MSDMMLQGINTGCCWSGLSFGVEVSGVEQEASKRYNPIRSVMTTVLPPSTAY